MTTVSVSSLLATLLLVFATQLSSGISSPSSTVPAFLWSSHLHGMKEMVDYRILSPRDLAKTAMHKGRWSNYLCSREGVQQAKNFAFLFVGTELQSLDISRPAQTDPALIGLLKDSFSNSNFSLAFPYVSSGEEQVAIESFLISEFADSCRNNLGINKIALVGSCSVEGENFDKLEDIHSVHDYLNSRMEKDSDGQTDLIVLCNGDPIPLQESDQPRSEGSILSQLLNSVNQLGAKYTVLYVSDPFRSVQHLPRGLERFLAEGTVGNGSVNSTICDGVCQIKSSLLEGLFVGIVLLVILISGLCCMMGIDTPTKFETPQDS